MKIEIDLSSDTKKWSKYNCSDAKYFLHLSKTILNVLKLDILCNTLAFAVTLSDKHKTQELNLLFRKSNQTTNVLSFPSGDTISIHREYLYLGDIVFSLETIEKESKEQHKLFCDHLSHLFIHSFLHLLGYTHNIIESRKEMEKLEIATLKKLGINNPYD